MVAILSLLLVITLSILVTRVATVALTHTGLSREAARFQARSAFTGAGFTTSESEKVVNHPVRRRIVLVLMLLGNAGIVTAVSSLILTFVNQGATGGSLVTKVVLLVAGVIFLWIVATSAWVDRRLSRFIDRLLRRYSSLDVRDYASLMRLGGDYRLAELAVDDDGWLAGRKLSDTALREEGVVVLGVGRPNGVYLGAPDGDTEVEPGDTLLVYGREAALADLEARQPGASGDRAHDRAVAEQRRVERREKAEDREAGDDDRGS